jgi:hypothetical protein
MHDVPLQNGWSSEVPSGEILISAALSLETPQPPPTSPWSGLPAPGDFFEKLWIVVRWNNKRVEIILGLFFDYMGIKWGLRLGL